MSNCRNIKWTTLRQAGPAKGNRIFWAHIFTETCLLRNIPIKVLNSSGWPYSEPTGHRTTAGWGKTGFFRCFLLVNFLDINVTLLKHMYADSPGCPGNKYVHNLMYITGLMLFKHYYRKRPRKPKLGENNNILGLRGFSLHEAGCIVGL